MRGGIGASWRLGIGSAARSQLRHIGVAAAGWRRGAYHGGTAYRRRLAAKWRGCHHHGVGVAYRRNES